MTFLLSILGRVSWGRVAAMLAIVTLVLAGLWKIHHSGVADGRAEVQAQWNVAKLAQNEADARAEADSRARERQLQTNADDLRRAKDAKITKISGELLAALDANRLLRAPRPADYTPAPAGTGPLCSGAGLFREDADFLSRESSRANGLRAAYLYCEAQYDAAVKAVNGQQ